MSQRPVLWDHQRRMHPQRQSNLPSADGEGAPCDHQSGACDIRELWPFDGESHEQFKARLTRKYGAAPVQEAQSHEQ